MRYINTSGYNPKKLKIESQKKLVELNSFPTIIEKKAFLDNASTIFEPKGKVKESETQIDDLFKQIGQL